MVSFSDAVKYCGAALRLAARKATVLVALALMPLTALAQTSFINFESGPVRPVAMTPDGQRVLVVNTPDNRLEVFDNSFGTLIHVDSIPVGLEPVSVAARTNSEVWVVNHLSDSVSVIDLDAGPAKVTRTLLVGDEPRDIVFAGTGSTRAFITTAHRGQHRDHSSLAAVPGSGDAQIRTPGIGRADVWVFDSLNLGSSIGGTPLEILSFFADTPRGLAVTPDGSTVYVAALHSGNQTTVINETVVPNGFGPNGVPGPSDNVDGVPAPEVGVIVKFNGTNWVSSEGSIADPLVRFNLPDHDVFSIDANTLAAASIVEFDHVGTILFNLVVNPVTGKVYVTNTELPNHVEFEGPGLYAGSTVQGRLSESRITVLTPAGAGVDPQHLNQHIDYSQLHTDPGADHAAINAQKAHTLATPLQPVVSSDGTKVYVAAFGSAKIGVFDAADIEDPNFESNFDPTVESANYISTGGGPAGMVLDEANNRMYVLTRFANQVEVINLGNKNTVQTIALHSPEPEEVVQGRKFLYDANLTSGNGEASCSSCHIFGDLDQLAWNLGNPDDHFVTAADNNTPIVAVGSSQGFHPMKGPMTTQTLRGMSTHGGLHWRGDRVAGEEGIDPCNDATGSACDEDLNFRNFIVAFEGLVGMEGTISSAEMEEFADFALSIQLPPNPIRALDNSLSADAAAGRTIFLDVNNRTDLVTHCEGCHTLDPLNGFYGTGGDQSFEGETQNFKVPHMRNLYHKVGMFGLSTGGPNMGDQIRGFGFLHDGSIDTVDHFLEASVFSVNDTQERQLEAFSMEFPTDLAPIVGQQITLDASNGAVTNPRIDLMLARANADFDSLILGGTVKECEVIAKATVGGVERGFWRAPGGNFQSDVNTVLTAAQVRALALTEGPVTFTCVPPGSGERMGVDRDEDGVRDGLDNCPGASNPGQADSDGDTLGDACDLNIDRDSDGVDDQLDNCPLVSNPAQTDTDGNGTGDACEGLPPGC
ncbi:MAG: thrombospondin type 3 repeat-containing protein [Gammaproteobacteria bacterium]|nr:thrombospondin type 3 repeat-containing protein [Gammaproteobacteria bacterium]